MENNNEDKLASDQVITLDALSKLKLDPNKKQAADHLDYGDIFENGLSGYPFARTRIEPVIYEVPDGAKVLDVGCNSGEVIKHLKEKKGCDVYGVDISQQLVDICHKKGLTNTFLCDADKMPFEDETFDVVILCEVLEHFDNPVDYLKEIRRVLKKDGFLLGTCPHANLEAHVWDDERKHKQYYTEDGLRSDLEKAFTKNYIRVLNGAQYNPMFSISLMADKPCEMLFKSGGEGTMPWDEQMKKDVTRVWMGPTQLNGVVYYRMTGPASKMDKYGVQVAHEGFKYDNTEYQMKWQYRLLPDPESYFNRELAGVLKFADVSVWQLVGTKAALSFLYDVRDPANLGNNPLKNKPLVTEIDDWFFDLPSYNIGSNPYKPNSDLEWIAYRQLELSDYVVCSTQFIKDGLLRIFPGKKIYVIPNSIDFSIWEKPVEDPYPKKDGVIRIGFTGCSNHNGDLELIKRPLKKLLEEHENVEFISYAEFPALKGLPRVSYTNKWMFIDKYPGEIKRWGMDIGLAPLRDNNFNRAKSNLRWLEYSALKIPTICSDVYPFTNSVQHGKTGIICNNTDLSWYESMKQMITDEGKRIAIGEAAYKRVKTKFNMDLIAKKYATVLKEIKCKGVNSTRKLEDSSVIPTTIDGQPTLSTVV